MADQEASAKQETRITAGLDDRPNLDVTALRNRGLTDVQAIVILQASTCVSEQELRDR